MTCSWNRRIVEIAIVCTTILLLEVLNTRAGEMPPRDQRVNLAARRPVLFSPKPNYALTGKGNTDTTDLTDGRTTARSDRRIWFESGAVGWSYGGRFNLAVDLGQETAIDEIAIRLLGGSPQPGVAFPVWIEAFTSDDGRNWYRVAECSRWGNGDFQRYGVPEAVGETWIHCLRMKDLKARGRWVGLRMYGGGLSCTDELYVFGSEASTTENKRGTPSDFSVTTPQPYFHKPMLTVTSHIATPLPIGLVTPEHPNAAGPFELVLDIPAGMQVLGGQIGGMDVAKAKTEPRADGGKQFLFSISNLHASKTFGRLYLQAPKWSNGQVGELGYRFSQGKWNSPNMTIPVRAVVVPKGPRLKRAMVGLGWWSASETAKWPGAMDAWQQLGLNSFPLHAHWMKDGDPIWSLVEQARQRDCFIVNIDSPLHRMLDRHKKELEIYDQMEDGSTSSHLCISYRGPFYQEEIQRFAKVMARARPDFASLDIELWGWRGPVDSKKCVRCRKDYEDSGATDWDQWQWSKGDQIWHDLVDAARKEIKKTGGNGTFDIGGYDFRPGPAYQNLWSVDRNYPKWMQDSQVSTYSCLYPYHLGLIGDEVRKDRTSLEHNDVLPWLTPGDAGTFPGEAFRWALLECYMNGARGVYFWSGRVWDAESLIAYNRVVRAIAPIEPIILKGDLLGAAGSVESPGRLSGLRHSNDLVLLAADYFGRSNGSLKLSVQIPARSEIRDLLSGQVWVPEIKPGKQDLTVPLLGARARLLHVRPLP